MKKNKIIKQLLVIILHQALISIKNSKIINYLVIVLQPQHQLSIITTSKTINYLNIKPLKLKKYLTINKINKIIKYLVITVQRLQLLYMKIINKKIIINYLDIHQLHHKNIIMMIKNNMST